MIAVRYLQITENRTERSPMSREIRKQRDGDGISNLGLRPRYENHLGFMVSVRNYYYSPGAL